MTTYEALVLAVGEAWADKVWSVVRDRSGLLNEIESIAPRWGIRVRGDGNYELYDQNAAARADWISRAADDVDQVARQARAAEITRMRGDSE